MAKYIFYGYLEYLRSKIASTIRSRREFLWPRVIAKEDRRTKSETKGFCLATLLDVNTDKILGTSKDKKMKQFWLSLVDVPELYYF
jgi:hypothetical protein